MNKEKSNLSIQCLFTKTSTHSQFKFHFLAVKNVSRPKIIEIKTKENIHCMSSMKLQRCCAFVVDYLRWLQKHIHLYSCDKQLVSFRVSFIYSQKSVAKKSSLNTIFILIPKQKCEECLLFNEGVFRIISNRVLCFPFHVSLFFCTHVVGLFLSVFFIHSNTKIINKKISFVYLKSKLTKLCFRSRKKWHQEKLDGKLSAWIRFVTVIGWKIYSEIVR